MLFHKLNSCLYGFFSGGGSHDNIKAVHRSFGFVQYDLDTRLAKLFGIENAVVV